MAEQLWKGRFSKAVDSRVNDFNSSIRFDQRMIAQDMRGSGVHAAMLAKQGIISEKDWSKSDILGTFTTEVKLTGFSPNRSNAEF